MDKEHYYVGYCADVTSWQQADFITAAIWFSIKAIFK